MKFFKRKDIIIILAIVLAGISLWGVFNYVYSGNMAKAEIYYKSKLVETIDLNRTGDKRFSIPQNAHVIFHLYSDGSICFEGSDCPDKICIKSGRLSRVGESAACLPNKIFLKIVPVGRNRDNDELDMIIGR